MISVDVKDVRLKYERVKKGNVCQLKSATDLIKICKEFCFLTCLKADDWTKRTKMKLSFYRTTKKWEKTRRQAGFFELGQWFHASPRAGPPREEFHTKQNILYL